MNNYSYVGSELELFSEAKNWKKYFSSFIKKYLGDDVLEVGAGNGSTTKVICQGFQNRWLCLEPDSDLISVLKSSIIAGLIPQCCTTKVGTLLDIKDQEIFDSIIYIDVLEHIENDQQEIQLALKHLKKDGYLIILSPAHQWLYTPFDKAINHYRRYDKKTLCKIMPKSLNPVKLIYLDSIGLFASLGNRLILKSEMPTKKQILFWDRYMVSLSSKLDPLIQYKVGKSILGIWQKNF